MNNDVKSYAKQKGVYLWQVAQQLGVNDGNLSRKLRIELPDEEKKKVFAVIDKLSEGR